jgi:protein TonB
MTKQIIILFFAFVLVHCKTTKWPDDLFIKKYNYQQVIGHIDEPQAISPTDKYAMYPNGLKGINDHIIKNIVYPTSCRNKNIEGKVILKYIVETDGYVKQIDIIQGVDPALEAEAIRIIKSMKRWIPGYKDGKPCRVEYRQPFNFRLK